MTKEEKAKRYDEALKIAKDVYTYYCDDREQLRKIESIFPELAESEDENIKKYILKACKETIEADDKGLELSMETTKKLAAYLEKQGEQKDILDEAVLDNNEDGLVADTIKYNIKQKPVKWSEEDEKQARQIERIVSDDGCTQKLQKQIADWFKSLKERVLPKQEWSDKDEKMIHHIENAIKYDKSRTYLNSKGIEIIDVCNWLKSLSPQNHWKPSDAQMDALESAIVDSISSIQKHSLESLYNELKKLF